MRVRIGTVDDFAKAVLAENPDLPVVRLHSESLFNRFPLRAVENQDKFRQAVKHIVTYGVGAVLLYGLVDVGTLGPLPDMYDPTWSTEKVVSLIAEGLAALGAVGLLLLPRTAPRAGERAIDG